MVGIGQQVVSWVVRVGVGVAGVGGGGGGGEGGGRVWNFEVDRW